MKISPSFWGGFVAKVARARRVETNESLSREQKRNLELAVSDLRCAAPKELPLHVLSVARLIDRGGTAALDVYCSLLESSHSDVGQIERSLANEMGLRWLAVEASMRFASMDTGFQYCVRAGDEERDVGNWIGGESAYRQALIMYPLHHGYRVQLAHMLKEQCRWVEAELNYSDALATGAPESDVLQHVEFSAVQSGESFDRPAALQVARFWSDRPMYAQRWHYPATSGDLERLNDVIGRNRPIELSDMLKILRGASSLAVAAERLAVWVADEGAEMAALVTSAMMMRAIAASAPTPHRHLERH